MIDLRPFCAKPDSGRAYLEKPFSCGDYTYATDGHKMIRVPRRDDVPENPDAPAAKCESYLRAKEPSGYAPITVIDLSAVEDEECGSCDGSGKAHDCPDCACKCDWCDGSGKIQAKVSVELHGALFNAHYINQLAALPGIELALSCKTSKPARFRFDGGVGVIMPLFSHYSQQVKP